MGKLVVATNENDILARFWKSGKYEKMDSSSPSEVVSDGKQGGVKETLSPAMDILVSSNFERLLWYLSYEVTSETSSESDRRKEACALLDSWMSKMKSDGRVEVGVDVLELARVDFAAERISDEQVCPIHPSAPLFILIIHFCRLWILYGRIIIRRSLTSLTRTRL